MRKVFTTTVVLLFLALASILAVTSSDTGVALAQTTNAIFSVKDGNWSDPSVWHVGRLPQAGENVIISPWTSVTYDVVSDEVLGQVLVHGVLRMSRTVDTRLKVSDHVVVGTQNSGGLSQLSAGGFLDMGTEEDPIPPGVHSELIFVLPQGNEFVGGPFANSADIGLWAVRGRWEVHGAFLNYTWSKLAADAQPGQDPAVIVARHDLTDWPIGGKVVVTQTSVPYRPVRHCKLEDACGYYWENELRTITGLQALPNGRTQITLDQPLEHFHQGTGQTRGEVALLTRNVLIRSEIPGVSDETLDHSVAERRFAHTMLMGTVTGKIQYAEFKYMGHLKTLARYPIHIHMTGAAGYGVEIRGNSVWRSGNRGYQVHNTQGVVVEDNVAFDTIMSSYYVERTGLPGEKIPKEDAVRSPHDNYVVHNLGIQATKATDIGQAQQNDDAIFWFDQMDQIVMGNVGVAAGANAGTGGIPEGSESPRPNHAGLWIGEQAAGSGEIRDPVFLKNELHSGSNDGLGMWITKGPGFNFVDTKVWRNGQDGVRWGYYRNPHRLYQLQAIENRDDGFGSDDDNRSGTRYLVDAELIGNLIGIKNGPDVVRPIYPDFPYTYIRPIFDGNTHAAMTLYSRECSDDPAEEVQPLSEKRACHGNYVQVLEPVFRCGTTIDFSDDTEKHSVVNGGNKNNQWRIKDAQGLPSSLPSDFFLLRPDQLDPANQTAFSELFVSDQARVAEEFNNEALVVPMDSLPDAISPPVWGHSGSNSGGGEVPPTNYYTFEKPVDMPPEVSVNVSLSGKVATLTAQATDDEEVARVEFYVDDVLVATDTEAPYQTTVDLSDHPRKYAYLYAVAFDHHLLTYSSASQGYLDNLTDEESAYFDFQTYDQRAFSKVVEIGPDSYNPSTVAPPANASRSLSTVRDEALDIDLFQVEGLGAPEDFNSFKVTEYPAHGELCGTAPNMTYTPEPEYGGFDSFTYQMTDISGNTTTVTVTLSITGAPVLYFSALEETPIGNDGLINADEDIISFDGIAFNRFFDGSDVGLADLQIDALSMISDNEILLSFSQDGFVPGIPGEVEDTDIVRFTATSLGESTSGTFDLFLHGRDVGLASNDDDIDSINLLPDGRILVSTLREFTALGDEGGLFGGGEDIIAFTPTTLGPVTSGRWDLYLDGSDVSLEYPKEVLTGTALDVAGNIYLSTANSFDVGTVSGEREDIFVFQPQALGSPTAGTYQPERFFDGSDYNMTHNTLMGIHIPVPRDAKVMVSPTIMSLTEGGPAGSYSVALNAAPTSPVEITPSPNAQVSVSPASLTFTPDNWDSPQTVTVTAVDDALPEGSHTGGVAHLSDSADPDFAGITVPGVAVNIGDNDTATPVAEDQSLSLDQNTSLGLTLTASDVDSAPEDLVFSIVDQPDHGSLAGTVPNLTYTPDPVYSGPDSFTFIVNDGATDSNLATVSLTVVPVAQPPVAGDQTVDTDEDTPLPLTLTATDLDNLLEDLTLSVLEPPANGTLSGAAPELVYTPNPDYFGPDQLTFQANDGLIDSNIATVTINVNPVNDAPVAGDQALSLDQNTSLDLTLAASDVDSPPEDLVFSIVDQPAHGSLSGAASALTYTPVPSYSGRDSFTYVVSDGQTESLPATVSFDVILVNQPPVAQDQTVNTDEDVPVTLTLTASDLDTPPEELVFNVLDQPAHGTLSGVAPELTYTPQGEYSGPDSFTFQVHDSLAGSNIATVSVNVNPVNDAPVAEDQTVTVKSATPLALTLAVTDPDHAPADLSYTILEQPDHGSLSGSAPDLTYVSDADFIGRDSFSFQVSDAVATSNVATVTINVIGDPLLYFAVQHEAVLGINQLVVTDQDIVSYDGMFFQQYFDGSDVGLGTNQIDAFSIISDTEILLSLSKDGLVPGIDGEVEDTDIVKFTATSLGEDTSGAFELYFHGRDVGLASNDEDIDGIQLLPDGRLLVSTLRTFTALGDEGGLTGGGEDIIAFTPTTLGPVTSGRWDLYLDGSDLGLDADSALLNAMAVDGEGRIYLSTGGGFTVDGLSGTRDDVFIFVPTSLGTPTTGAFLPELFFDGNGDNGMESNSIYGLALPLP